MSNFTLKVSKSQKQFLVSSILPKHKRKQFDLKYYSSKIEFFRSFFGRIEETINCSLDLLTFKSLPFSLKWKIRANWLCFLWTPKWIRYSSIFFQFGQNIATHCLCLYLFLRVEDMKLFWYQNRTILGLQSFLEYLSLQAKYICQFWPWLKSKHKNSMYLKNAGTDRVYVLFSAARFFMLK